MSQFPPWHAVADGLPEPAITVLAYDRFYGKIAPAEAHDGAIRYDDGDDDCDITHWMELPPPPTAAPGRPPAA